MRGSRVPAGRTVGARSARVRGDDPERGDVPGWVMITVMTAALVLAILIPFRDGDPSRAVSNALASDRGCAAAPSGRRR